MKIFSEKLDEIKKLLINTSIGPSAVRNQGKGIINPIRTKLSESFFFKDFFAALNSESDFNFEEYINDLTNKVKGLTGVNKDGTKTGDKVYWGTARKCINLLFRSTVYSGHIWQEYHIKDSDFAPNSNFKRLELPLDKFSINGIKRRCKEFNIEYEKQFFNGFTIIGIKSCSSEYLQSLARQVSIKLETCRIDLDLEFWRYMEDEED